MSLLTSDSLSEREQEILQLLDDGLSDREIAQKLTLSLSTVKWYNRQIYDKLDVGSRAQAVARARQLKLLDGSAAPEAPLTHNLPAQTTRLIGRQREIAEIQRLLQTVRLLTLTGPPGTGKTRLALQVAAEIAHQIPVCFVTLSALNDAAQIPSAIAQALGVEEIVSEPPIETLKCQLQAKNLLLVLDNFEHLLSGVPVLSELLAAAPHVKALITSRAALNLYGETEYVVPPLTLPDIADTDSIAGCEAVALFVQRAQAARPGFELTDANALDIAKICVRLDGLPLAIELAAARTKMLSPNALLERLSSRLATLVGGARDLPARQQTLRGTIDWSYDLLTDVEKTLFARLAVFSGGWSLEAAEWVCCPDLSISVLDGLTALIDKGLVQHEETSFGDSRFMMLETIREYALERFEASGEAEAIRRAHADYFIDFVERTGRALDTLNRSVGLSRLEIEQNNIRAVLSRSLTSDVESGLRLIAAVGVCWRIRSYMVEGFYWSQQLLDKALDAEPGLRARALSTTGTLLACHLGKFAEAEAMSQEALELAQRTEDQRTLAGAWFARGTALIELDPSTAHAAIDSALALYRRLDDRWELARTVNLKGELLRMQQRYDEAESHYDEALRLFRELGNPWGINIVLSNLAFVAQHEQNHERAHTLFTEGLKVSTELKDWSSFAICMDGLAGVLGAVKEPEQAALMLGAADGLRERIGAHIQAGDRGDYERNLALVRAQMDTAAFEACWNEGRALSIEQMIENALKPRLVRVSAHSH